MEAKKIIVTGGANRIGRSIALELANYENLNPSLEPSHAFAEVIKIAPKLSKDTICIVNSCGDAKKDKYILKKKLGNYVFNK